MDNKKEQKPINELKVLKPIDESRTSNDKPDFKEQELKLIYPDVTEPYSSMNKGVTASMFLNNKILNVDEIRKSIDVANNPLGIKEQKNSSPAFKRYNVAPNTIIKEGNSLKVINPVKKVIRVSPEDIQKIINKENTSKQETNNEQKPQVKVVQLGGIPTIVDIANKNHKIKEIIEDELHFLEEQETTSSPKKNKDDEIPNEIKKEIEQEIINDNNPNNDNLDDIEYRASFISGYKKYFNKKPEEVESIKEELNEVSEPVISEPIEQEIIVEPKKQDEVIITEPIIDQLEKPEEIEVILEDEPTSPKPIREIIVNKINIEPEKVEEKYFDYQLDEKQPIEYIKIDPPKPIIEEPQEPVEIEYISSPKKEEPVELEIDQINQEPIQEPINNENFYEFRNIDPIKIIEKDVIELQPEFIANRIINPIRIIEKEFVEMDEETYRLESVNYVDDIQPDEQNDTPKKLYRRLSEQEFKDKIITNWELNLPQKGELIYYPDVNYAIEMIDIYKSFNDGKVIANNGINLRVRENNVHAIIGENGAGKSVLMSILFGIYNADSGIIKVNGEEVVFSSAKDASLKGIGMVHQHFKLVETDSVFQNIILGSEETNAIGFLKTKDARRKIEELNNKYHFNLNLDKKVSELNVADQQKTEILKLLYKDANILIFDEPTAVLSEHEINQFLDIVQQLKENGKTIILITHKFKEIRKVADRATIIRLGTFISEFDMNEKSDDEIIHEMVGNNIDFVKSESQGYYLDETVFEVKDLVIDEKINKTPINFTINKGEIFAIAGVTGNGQSELALTIAGLLKNKSGQILINNKNINNLSVLKRYRDGLAYVPEDRHKYSVILDLPIYLNTVIDKIDEKPYSKSGFMNTSIIKEYTRLFIKKNDIRGTSRGTTPIRNLSGGNQQKLVIARELDKNYEVLVLEQPTRGLDVAAINKIHKEILEEKAKGKAILLISYELDEILSIADTVAVMNKYQIVDKANIRDIDRDMIGQLMVGDSNA